MMLNITNLLRNKLNPKNLNLMTLNHWWWYEYSEYGTRPLKNQWGDDALSAYCPSYGTEMREK